MIRYAIAIVVALVLTSLGRACDFNGYGGSSLSLVTPQVSQVQTFGYFAPPVASFGYLAAPVAVPYAVNPYFAPAVPLGFGGYGGSFGVVRSRAFFGVGHGFGFGFNRGFGFGFPVRQRVFIR